MSNKIRNVMAALLVCIPLLSTPAWASFHLWDISEVFSNADGSVQFIELFSRSNSQQFTSGRRITTDSNTFTFDRNTPAPTGKHHLLLATDGFADLAGGVEPDFLIPSNYFDPVGDTIDFVGAIGRVTISNAPADGFNSLNFPGGLLGANSPTNYAGITGSLIPVQTIIPVPLNGTGESYLQDFDLTLGSDGSTVDTPIPNGWVAEVDGSLLTAITQPFPPDVITSGSFNAGDGEDRTLGIAVDDNHLENNLQLNFQIINEATRAIRLTYDIESWGANLNAANPGEAAFQTTLEVDGETVIDFGTTTTGKVLTPGLLNGNESPNRVSYDSGIVEVSIAPDTPAKINWSVPEDSSTNGWLFGLDNVVFRTLAAGDVDGDGDVDPLDLTILLAADTFGKGDIDATWAQGDFDNDGDFDAADVSAILSALDGQFPREFAGDEIGSIEAANAIVVPEPSSWMLLVVGVVALSVRFGCGKRGLSHVNLTRWKLRRSMTDEPMLQRNSFYSKTHGIDCSMVDHKSTVKLYRTSTIKQPQGGQ